MSLLLIYLYAYIVLPTYRKGKISTGLIIHESNSKKRKHKKHHIIDAQAIYDTLKETLKDNQKALEYMQKDADIYNSMNKEIGLKEIDFEYQKNIEEQRLNHDENTIVVTQEKNMSVEIPAENVEFDGYEDFDFEM